MDVELDEVVYLTKCLSVFPYSTLDEVLDVIVGINGMVYLLINQSENYDILLVECLFHCDDHFPSFQSLTLWAAKRTTSGRITVKFPRGRLVFKRNVIPLDKKSSSMIPTLKVHV